MYKTIKLNNDNIGLTDVMTSKLDNIANPIIINLKYTGDINNSKKEILFIFKDIRDINKKIFLYINTKLKIQPINLNHLQFITLPRIKYYIFNPRQSPAPRLGGGGRDTAKE